MSVFLSRVLAALDDGGDHVLFHHDGTTLTYREAGELLSRFYGGLSGVHGTVAIDAGNRPEIVLAQLAAQLRGVDVLLIAASASRPARAAALETTGAALLTDSDLDALAGSEPSTPDTLPGGVTTVFPSGGTTGVPKLIRHRGIYDGMAGIFRPDGTRTVLVTAPLTHMTGNAAVLGALLCGDTVVLHRKFDADAVLAAIERHRVTALSLTPARLAAVLDSPSLHRTDLSSVRQLSLGAAPLSPRRLTEALSVFGPVVGQGYGLTEAPMIASISAAEVLERPELLGSVGRIVPGMEARVEDGEVSVRGLSMMEGYHGRPPIGDGWLPTGDLGHFDEDGYLYLHDRSGDVIVTGEHGTKVASTAVEHALLGHPRVRNAAVFAVPGPGGEGELVHAVVVTAGAVTAGELRAHVREELGGEHFVPAAVEITDHLPLTAVGKVDKRALRAPFWRGHSRGIA
ncbi:class I adenylate-forming enzyme family protein [Amycolatopsis jiangsuensis]|uniref:Acyl-CoA synthetase (AMP-forming)/AMP-acid ligase II n=1 Tax=Amycolatopsis jiangsuensis TaxID=1181879 RepID=A0A840J484_9PSEU|nr:AMP-binding protein [Amycolatopsis jiangsuensis]MBB4688673.1 acyl-CoA synthetase (AMP-forming)/AMP-acid ligase II [Amycolatopsis jiangsuensis]